MEGSEVRLHGWRHSSIIYFLLLFSLDLVYTSVLPDRFSALLGVSITVLHWNVNTTTQWLGENKPCDWSRGVQGAAVCHLVSRLHDLLWYFHTAVDLCIRFPRQRLLYFWGSTVYVSVSAGQKPRRSIASKCLWHCFLVTVLQMGCVTVAIMPHGGGDSSWILSPGRRFPLWSAPSNSLFSSPNNIDDDSYPHWRNY